MRYNEKQAQPSKPASTRGRPATPPKKFGGKGGSRDYDKLREAKPIPTKDGYK